MSIAVLAEVHNESRRLAIAGSGLAKGDFRLEKLIAPLEKAGEKAPVFAKVALAIRSLIDSEADCASERLLELSTLVTAILYTQGKTGAEGELRPIETSEFELPTSEASALLLKPLIEALTTTGSGRLEIIRDAYDRGAFMDLRLLRPALIAIDDSYSEIGDFVSEKVLPMYGKAIEPQLRGFFKLKGRSGDVRRLKLLHRIDAEGNHDLVEQALESGSKDMKVAAIACLKDSKGHLSYLLEQSKARIKDVRRAAFSTLARFTENDVVDSLIKALSGGDVEMVAGPASENCSPKLLKHLIETGRKQFKALFEIKDKKKLDTALDRFWHFLEAFRGRDDKESLAFLTDCFEQREALEKLAGSSYEGGDLVNQIIKLMVHTNAKPTHETLIGTHETLSPRLLPWAFVAALHSRSPKQVFDLFAPYYEVKIAKKRGRNLELDKQNALREVITNVANRSDIDDAVYHGYDDDHDADSAAPKNVKLDPRWLEAAIKKEDLALIHALAIPKHKDVIALLSKAMDRFLAAKGSLDYEATNTLVTMVRINHPQLIDYVIRTLERENARKIHHYGELWWLMRIIPALPKSALPKLEALLPSLKDKVVDFLIPMIETLKTKEPNK